MRFDHSGEERAAVEAGAEVGTREQGGSADDVARLFSIPVDIDRATPHPVLTATR